MKRLIPIALAAATVMVPGIISAADVEAGKAKAAACAGCHVAGNPLAQVLEGMPERYLIKATKAYATGERNDLSMKAFVSTLSDEDIANLSAYYASQPCK